MAIFTPGGFHAPEDIAGVLMQVRLNKGGGFQLQRGQVAQLPVLRRKMQFQKISGDVGIRQERPERSIMRRGRRGVFLLTHGSSIKSAASQQSSPKSPQPRGQQLRSKP